VAELMTTIPLDTNDLLQSPPADAPYRGLPAGTTMGHVHFRVADIPETTAFWRDVIGLEVMASFAGQAGFYASGGYHHHVGANVWESRGAPPAPADHATLVSATLVFEDDEVRAAVADRAGAEDDTVTDPSGIRLRLAY
jgi:catechol 2,3-dioxygenase